MQVPAIYYLSYDVLLFWFLGGIIAYWACGSSHLVFPLSFQSRISRYKSFEMTLFLEPPAVNWSLFIVYVAYILSDHVGSCMLYMLCIKYINN